MAGSKGMHSYKTFIFNAAFGVADPAGDQLGGEWTPIAEVISINGLPMNPSVTRLTHLDSDTKAHEKIPGFLDAGQITFRVNYHSALTAGKLALPALMALLPHPDVNDVSPAWGRYQWVVQFPDGAQWYATAFIQGMPFDVPDDDRIAVEFTLEVSGRPTFNTP